MKTVIASLLLAIALPAIAAEGDHVTAYVTAGKSTTNRHGQDDLESLNVDYTRPLHFRWNLQVGSAAAIWRVRQPQTFFGEGSETAFAGYLALLARHSFPQHGAIEPYVELLSGAMVGNKDIPVDTERFNFNSQGGGGVFIHSGAHPIMLGLRIGHISNLVFAEHNPGINYATVVVGVRLR